MPHEMQYEMAYGNAVATGTAERGRAGRPRAPYGHPGRAGARTVR